MTRAEPVAITNRDPARPARILGATKVRTLTGCARVLGLPLTIPPGEVCPVTVEYLRSKPGAETAIVSLYTDSPGQPVISVPIVCLD